MKALLIIDMQQISFTSKSPRFDSEAVVKKINELSSIFRQNGDMVIFIQHDGSKEGFCIPNTEEWKILPSLIIKPEDLFISKTANDSFYQTSLKEELINHCVEDIVITGCATDFCVDSTIKSALTNELNITVISNAHTTADRPNLSAKQVIDHYNWIWQELTPTKGKIEVIDFEKFIISLKFESQGLTN
jgi:nicotinamidase-related amidase